MAIVMQELKPIVVSRDLSIGALLDKLDSAYHIEDKTEFATMVLNGVMARHIAFLILVQVRNFRDNHVEIENAPSHRRRLEQVQLGCDIVTHSARHTANEKADYHALHAICGDILKVL